MRFVSIASGSSGNSIYVGSDSTHLLVDAGISSRRIEQGLESLGIRADELSAVVITHEHSDHVKGVSVLVRRHQLPVYATAGTMQALRQGGMLAGCPEELLHEIRAEERFAVGDMELLPFAIDHDAAEPVAFRIESGSRAVAVATDMGHYTTNDHQEVTEEELRYIVTHLDDLVDHGFFFFREVLGILDNVAELFRGYHAHGH